MKYLQDFIANLLWIQLGKTFYVDPFSDSVLEKNLTDKEKAILKKRLKNSFTSINSSEKRIKVIAFLCQKTNNNELSKYILSFYNNHLRNSFYHSKYLLSKNGYIGFDKKTNIKLNYNELTKKLDKCISFYTDLISLIEHYRKSYTKTITIKGRKCDYSSNNLIDSYEIVDVIVVANPRLGIVNTMMELKKGSSNKKEKDNFLNRFIEFAENYDLNINQDDSKTENKQK
jgi:hypothetical protein